MGIVTAAPITLTLSPTLLTKMSARPTIGPLYLVYSGLAPGGSHRRGHALAIEL